MLDWIKSILDNYTNGMYFPNIHIKDVIEILIVAVIVYEIMLWIKNTKAWMLLRGIIMLGVFILLAWIFQMHTILYLAAQSINVLAIAAVVVFQPELRRALEKLGEKNLLSNINPFDKNRENERFSDQTAEGIVTACFEMGKVCTGALIVVEQAIQLTEYEMTGIELDCKVSPQVLINIFEHNTPLHDGAIIIRGDRITSATCYLPLSDNMRISKDLGTRHRAALGMSEVCDALVIAVSEETGLVSVAMGGQLDRGITREELRKRLSQIQYRNAESKRFFLAERMAQKMKKYKFTDNLGLKIIAVIFAAFLWLIVVNLDNPVSTQTFSEVPVTIINEDIILSAGDTYQVLGEEKVSVVVSATRQVRQKLTKEDIVATAI